LTCDEVSLINNQNWLLVHAYVVQNWLHIPILFYLECVVVRSSVDNLTQMLMQSLMNQGSLSKDMVGKKFMTFGADGVFVFQNVKLRVTK
jgi:hypothetical protein